MGIAIRKALEVRQLSSRVGSHTPSRSRIWLALGAVYLVWGSTYLAIRVAVHPSHGTGLPPMLLAGSRFTLAGLIMLVFAVRRPAPDGRPDPLGATQWFAAAVVGLALILGGNGLVTIAERRIPSGTAAVVVATVPIWAALLAAALGRERLSVHHIAGLVLGFTGVAALVVEHRHRPRQRFGNADRRPRRALVGPRDRSGRRPRRRYAGRSS